MSNYKQWSKFQRIDAIRAKYRGADGNEFVFKTSLRWLIDFGKDRILDDYDKWKANIRPNDKLTHANIDCARELAEIEAPEIYFYIQQQKGNFKLWHI